MPNDLVGGDFSRDRAVCRAVGIVRRGRATRGAHATGSGTHRPQRSGRKRAGATSRDPDDDKRAVVKHEFPYSSAQTRAPRDARNAYERNGAGGGRPRQPGRRHCRNHASRLHAEKRRTNKRRDLLSRAFPFPAAPARLARRPVAHLPNTGVQGPSARQSRVRESDYEPRSP